MRHRDTAEHHEALAALAPTKSRKRYHESLAAFAREICKGAQTMKIYESQAEADAHAADVNTIRDATKGLFQHLRDNGHDVTPEMEADAEQYLTSLPDDDDLGGDEGDSDDSIPTTDDPRYVLSAIDAPDDDDSDVVESNRRRIIKL